MNAVARIAPGIHEQPVNYDAETQLLGGILMNNRAYERVEEFLTADMFADPRHARIFEVIGKLLSRGVPASPVSLKNYFEQDASLAEFGGSAYLGKLAGAAVMVGNAGDLGRIIRDCYIRREMMARAHELIAQACNPDVDIPAEKIAAEFSEGLDALTAVISDAGGAIPLRQAMDEALELADRAMKTEGGITGVATGLTKLDKKLGGLHPTDFVVIAGRPSMGKTALGTKIAVNAAKAYAEGIPEGETETRVISGAKVLFYSHEMSKDQLASRIIADETGVSADRQRRGQFTMDEFREMQRIRRELAHLPLWIDDTAGLTVARIRQRARRLKRSQGLGMIVIDYLQLIEGDGRGRGDANRVQEVTAISRGLKTLAKELNIPVIALSQLSREVEKRDDKRPRLSDLRESGAIEQDADTVMLVYRHEYYLRKEKPQKRPGQKDEAHSKATSDWLNELEKCTGRAEVIIDKNRHGPLGIVDLAFNGARTTFDNLPEETDPGPAPPPNTDAGYLAAQEQAAQQQDLLDPP